MPSIISYQKAYDATTTYQLTLPDGATELCEIAGMTYIVLPDGAMLPPQAEQIDASVSVVTLDAALRTAIIAASPHCALIDERMHTKIRDVYQLEDELKYARIGVGAAMGMYQPTADEVAGMIAFGTHVETVRQWGRDERAKLGL
jgi:predicted signal transduction protein with EAL and GGDEF domain